MDRLMLLVLVSLTFLAPLLGATIISAAMVRLRLLQGPSVLQNGIRLGIAIGIVRVPLVWVSALGFQYSDWRQVAGYFLVMFNSFSETLLVRAWRHEVLTWAAILSGLVAISSMVLGFALATLVQIFRKRGAPA